METKGFFQFEITRHVLVSSFLQDFESLVNYDKHKEGPRTVRINIFTMVVGTQQMRYSN